jgi:chromosome segregation ATPase
MHERAKNSDLADKLIFQNAEIQRRFDQFNVSMKDYAKTDKDHLLKERQRLIEDMQQLAAKNAEIHTLREALEGMKIKQKDTEQELRHDKKELVMASADLKKFKDVLENVKQYITKEKNKPQDAEIDFLREAVRKIKSRLQETQMEQLTSKVDSGMESKLQESKMERDTALAKVQRLQSKMLELMQQCEKHAEVSSDATSTEANSAAKTQTLWKIDDSEGGRGALQQELDAAKENLAACQGTIDELQKALADEQAACKDLREKLADVDSTQKNASHESMKDAEIAELKEAVDQVCWC